MLSKISRARLATAHPDLQRLVYAVNKRIPVYVLQGHRSEIEQEMDFQNGTTKAHFGESPHNYIPALAVDLGPDPLDWKDITSFRMLAEIVIQEAVKLGLDITWGGHWPTLRDHPHFEFTDWRERVKKAK